MLPTFAHQTIEIVHPSEWKDDHGTQIPKYDLTNSATIETIEDCVLEPTDGAEDQNGLRWDYDLNAPPGTPLTGSDLVRYGGIVYKVIAPPQEFESPTGLLDYQHSKLETWKHGN
jgi:hypothetical protein